MSTRKRTYGFKKDRNFEQPRIILQRTDLMPPLSSVPQQIRGNHPPSSAGSSINPINHPASVNSPRASSPINSTECPGLPDFDDDISTISNDEDSSSGGQDQPAASGPMAVIMRGISSKLDMLVAEQKTMDKALSRLENKKLAAKKRQPSDTPAWNVLLIDDEFLSDTKCNFEWRGIQMRDEITLFLMSLTIEVNDINPSIRTIIRRFFGVRNLRMYLLTTSEKNDPRSRPRMKDRDVRGYEICKYVCNKVCKEAMLAKKRLEIVATGSLTEEQIDQKLTHERRVLSYRDFSKTLFGLGAQAGRDYKANRGKTLSKSYYWELMDRQDGVDDGKPHPKWTIWDEVSISDKGNEKKDTESSVVFSRVLRLQAMLKDAIEKGHNIQELKDQFDVWGKEKVVVE